MRDIIIVNADISTTVAVAGGGGTSAIGTDDVDDDVNEEWSAVTLIIKRE